MDFRQINYDIINMGTWLNAKWYIKIFNVSLASCYGILHIFYVV